MALRLLTRAGIVAGTVICTAHLGIWDDADHTSEMYGNVLTELKPFAGRVSEKLNMPKLPPSGECKFLAQHFYNCAVKQTFHMVNMLPNFTKQAMAQTYSMVEQCAHNGIQPLQAVECLYAVSKQKEMSLATTESNVDQRPQRKTTTDDVSYVKRGAASHYD